MNPLMEWVSTLTQQESARAISEKVGRSHTAVSKWLRSGCMPAEVVIDIARSYNGDVVEGLLAGGLMIPADLANGGLRSAVRHAPTIFLTEELHARATAAETAKASARPHR
jgi:hypothetical protein